MTGETDSRENRHEDVGRRIKGVTLRDKVKNVDIRKELGVKSIQEKVREMRLYCMMVPGNRPRGRPRERWIASEGTCRNCGSPRRMPRTEHYGNQEFGPLTPPSGKRRRRRIFLMISLNKHSRVLSLVVFLLETFVLYL